MHQLLPWLLHVQRDCSSMPPLRMGLVYLNQVLDTSFYGAEGA